MNDLTSKQAAIQTALEFIVEYLGGAFDEDFQKELIERMNALPSAQRNGKWIKEHEEWFADHPYKCTNCGKYSRARYHFCPNCGADMQKEGE